MQRDIPALSSQSFDLLVIGAGVHGACVARDAALRGLKVAMIDKADICGATSHNSLKTIHGGIRYLQHLNIKRTLESIKEQKYWLETAPHLVKPLQFMMPTYGFGMRGPIAMYLGIRLFELLSFGRNRRLSERSKLSRGKILSKRACLALAPDISTDKLTGGAVWDEAQVEFADRAVLQLADQAVSCGAVVANYVTARKFLVDGDTVVGIEAVDELTKTRLCVNARMVVNAAGPWAAELLQESGVQSVSGLQIPLSKSMNVVTRLPSSSIAIGVQSTLQSDSRLGTTKRLYFMVPWQGHTVIGTTHFPHSGSADDLDQNPREISDFVAQINLAYPSLQLSMQDVIYCYQGLGPADDDVSSKATQLHHSKVIDHASEHSVQGLISIISVKWTTARLVAERAVDLVVKNLAANTSLTTQKCQTRHAKIPDQPELRAEFHTLSNDKLVDLCQHHMRQTMAVRLSDMLLRRSNDLVTSRLSLEQIRLIATTMTAHLGWTAEDQQAELAFLRSHWLADDIYRQLDSINLWSSTA